MMLGLRSWNLTRRQESAEAIVRKALPSGFKVMVEPIAVAIARYGFGPTLISHDLYYRSRPSSHWASKPHDEIVGADLNIKNEAGKTVLQVRVWKDSRPIIRYDSELELQLAKNLARVLRREGLYVRKLEPIQGTNDVTEPTPAAACAYA